MLPIHAFEVLRQAEPSRMSLAGARAMCIDHSRNADERQLLHRKMGFSASPSDFVPRQESSTLGQRHSVYRTITTSRKLSLPRKNLREVNSLNRFSMWRLLKILNIRE